MTTNDVIEELIKAEEEIRQKEFVKKPCFSYIIIKYENGKNFVEADIVGYNKERYLCLMDSCKDMTPGETSSTMYWDRLDPGVSEDLTKDNYDMTRTYHFEEKVIVLQHTATCMEEFCKPSDGNPMSTRGAGVWIIEINETTIQCDKGTLLQDGVEIPRDKPSALKGELTSKESLEANATKQDVEIYFKTDNFEALSDNTINFIGEHNFTLEALAYAYKCFRYSLSNFASAQPQPVTRVITVSNFMENVNVKRVNTWFSEKTFKDLLPLTKPVATPATAKVVLTTEITHQHFLIAVSHVPGFCSNETEISQADADDECRRTLLTFWTHVIVDTTNPILNSTLPEYKRGLSQLTEVGCPGSTKCKNYGGKDKDCMPADGKEYYWRAHHTLKGARAYCDLSEILFNDKDVLRLNPDLVTEDPILMFLAMLINFVRSELPKPSNLSVVKGIYQPNSADIISGHSATFGLTILLWTNYVDCRENSNDSRINRYQEIADAWGIDVDQSDLVGCSNASEIFSVQSNANQTLYFGRIEDSTEPNCELQTTPTGSPIFSNDPYNRCVEAVRQEMKREAEAAAAILNKPISAGVDQSTLYTQNSDNTFAITDPSLLKVIASIQYVENDPVNIDDNSGESDAIKRLMKFLPKTKYDDLTKNAQSGFEYQAFINEANNWPAFCNENGSIKPTDSQTEKDKLLDQACEEETTLLLAYMILNTGKEEDGNIEWDSCFTNMFDQKCIGNNTCLLYNVRSRFVTPDSKNTAYYCRSPGCLQTSFDYALASFELFNDRYILLNNPELVANDPKIAMKVTFWKWMRPKLYLGPPHMIATKMIDINDDHGDITKYKLTLGLGGVLMALSRGRDCEAASNRAKEYTKLYIKLCEVLGVQEVSSTNFSCEQMTMPGPESSGSYPIYFDVDRSATDPKCMLQLNQTFWGTNRESALDECLMDLAKKDSWNPSKDLLFQTFGSFLGEFQIHFIFKNLYFDILISEIGCSGFTSLA